MSEFLKKIFNISVFLILPNYLFPQVELLPYNITLDEALEIARNKSVDAYIAKNNMIYSYWEFRKFKADIYPNLTLGGELPAFNKSLSRYQNPDGSYSFIPKNILSENLTLSISQNIAATGGTVYLQSQIERIDQVNKSGVGSFLLIPVELSIVQPLISAQTLKWAQKIEPIKLEEAKKDFSVNIETINVKTINYYFDLLIAYVNKNIATQNYERAKELLRIAYGKKEIGLISENDLQQLIVGELNASGALITSEQDYLKKMTVLRSHLGFDNTIEIIPHIPHFYPDYTVTYESLMEKAKNNNPIYDNFKRRMLEMEKNVQKAKANRGFKANLNLSVGLTGSDKNFIDSYHSLNNMAVVSLGIQIPIIDWGKGKGTVIQARSQQELEEVKITNEQNNFEEKCQLLVMQIHKQKELTEIYKQAGSLAETRYKTAFKLFNLGKISILDIYAAQNEENNARRNYINQLYASWLYYYYVRQITLYDYLKKEKINWNNLYNIQ